MPRSANATPAPTSGRALRLRRAVLVVVDSLRADLLRPDTTPALARLAAQGCRFAAHRSVFPSTTRTASASIATGCLPRHHGLLGNSMAIDEGAGLVCLTTGKADFRERLRAATGRVLARPTLAQRLAAHGGAVVFSNASPGAAHLQDPDGHGFLYNRAGSHGPGLRPLPAGQHLTTPKGSAGDAAATDRFVAEALLGASPALAVLWLSEPDHTGHHHALGGPEHRKALAGADACVAHVLEAVQRLHPDGQELLLAVTSDHGQETTDRVVDVAAELVAAGLKDAPDSRDVVPASQGTSALFFVAPAARGRTPALLDWLRSRDWAAEVYADGRLGEVGLDTGMALAAAVSLRKSDRRNEHGVPGYGDIMYEPGGINNVGCGQHGGTGRWEQSPFLILHGGGFPPASVREAPTSPMDLAPTILRHLGLPADGMDGRALQDA
jgi:arylsulfatase A-like enzyme